MQEKRKNEEISIANRERTLLEGILYYLSYLLRNKILIIVITTISALGSIAFSIVSLRLPPDESPYPNFYHAYAVLIVDQAGGGEMTTMLASLGIQAPGGGNEMNYGELGLRVLRSRPFIDAIVKEHNIVKKYEIEEKIKATSRELVLGNSQFDYEPRTGTLTIGYEDIDPVFARDVVESMVESLQEWFLEWDGTSSQQQLTAMEKKIGEVSNEISRLEKEIEDFQTEYGVMSVTQLAEAQTAMITDLQTQLIQTEVAIKSYSGFSTIEDPELIQLQAQKESLQELIRQIESGNSGSGRRMPSRDELPALAIEYSHMRMSHEIQMRIFQNLKEQYEVQKLTSTGTSAFSVLEHAEIPDEKSRPSRGQLCIIATLIGFVFSIFLAIFIDIIRNVKNDPEKKKILKGEI